MIATDLTECYPDMAPQEIQGKTLGEKHKHYNELVNKAIRGNHEILAQDFNVLDTDITNLIKIDIAGKSKNFEYILKVLQCQDMLYVSRAIKHSRWLITDRVYSHIINPRYLHTQLFPNMTSQACAKLLLHIRLHLKDVDRVDDFYNFLKERNIHAAVFWLPCCSLPLAENEVAKHSNIIIERKLRKRLYEKSITLVEIMIKNTEQTFYKNIFFRETMYLLERYSGKMMNSRPYLDFIFETCEDLSSDYDRFFGPKATSVLMKSCPQRILDKIGTYCEWIDMYTFVKHLESKEITDLISKVCEKDELKYCLKYDNFNHFVRYLPEDGRFEFIKNFVIEKSRFFSILWKQEVFEEEKICQWYRFAPFKVAFSFLIKLIDTLSNSCLRYYDCIYVYDILLSSANGNAENIQTVLKHFNDKFNNNADFELKIRFVNILFKKTDTFRFSETNWNALNELFHSMELYGESKIDVREQLCFTAIILYKLLHNENIPQIIKKKYNYRIMESFKRNLTDEEKNKVFDDLYKTLEHQIQNKTINSENVLIETVHLLENMQVLLTDWNKNHIAYPWFLNKVKEVIKVKIVNSWKANLATLYNENKVWRRIMFEESLLLSPSEDTCFNALKHDPELMTRYQSAVEELRRDDNKSLRRVLRALRVYWPQTLAVDWAKCYLNRLGEPGVNKSVIRGLCPLAPQHQLINIIKSYADEFNGKVELNIRKNFAGNLSSIIAILHNMSAAPTRERVSKLFDAPVFLQKYGFRIAFTNLESEELKGLLHDIWKNSGNSTIRWVLFKQTYDLLCRQTDPKTVQEVWELLSIFIDNLSTDDNKIIFETLVKDYTNLPAMVRFKFFTKRLIFFKSLPSHKLNEYAIDIDMLMEKIIAVIDELDPNFIEVALVESGEQIFRHSELLIIYMLCAKDVESQSERYRRVLLPVLKRAFQIWDVHLTDCVKHLLHLFSLYFQKYTFGKNMVLPTKLFHDIQLELSKLPFENNYQLQTTWKLYATYVSSLEEHKEILATIQKDHIELDEEEKRKVDKSYYFKPKAETKWNEVYIKALPVFSKICLEYLQEDVSKYGPSICLIFAGCLKSAFQNINRLVYLECLKSLLDNTDEVLISGYLVVLESVPIYESYCGFSNGRYYKMLFMKDEEENIYLYILEKIFSNRSSEIKYHYYNKFNQHDMSDLFKLSKLGLKDVKQF